MSDQDGASDDSWEDPEDLVPAGALGYASTGQAEPWHGGSTGISSRSTVLGTGTSGEDAGNEWVTVPSGVPGQHAVPPAQGGPMPAGHAGPATTTTTTTAATTAAGTSKPVTPAAAAPRTTTTTQATPVATAAATTAPAPAAPRVQTPGPPPPNIHKRGNAGSSNAGSSNPSSHRATGASATTTTTTATTATATTTANTGPTTTAAATGATTANTEATTTTTGATTTTTGATTTTAGATTATGATTTTAGDTTATGATTTTSGATTTTSGATTATSGATTAGASATTAASSGAVPSRAGSSNTARKGGATANTSMAGGNFRHNDEHAKRVAQSLDKYNPVLVRYPELLARPPRSVKYSVLGHRFVSKYWRLRHERQHGSREQEVGVVDQGTGADTAIPPLPRHRSGCVLAYDVGPYPGSLRVTCSGNGRVFRGQLRPVPQTWRAHLLVGEEEKERIQVYQASLPGQGDKPGSSSSSSGQGKAADTTTTTTATTTTTTEDPVAADHFPYLTPVPTLHDDGQGPAPRVFIRPASQPPPGGLGRGESIAGVRQRHAIVADDPDGFTPRPEYEESLATLGRMAIGTRLRSHRMVNR